MSQDTQTQFQLTPEQERRLQSVHDRIAAAVAVQVAAGYRVQPGDWGIYADGPQDEDGVLVQGQAEWQPEPGGTTGTCLCPMACALVGTEATGDFEGDAAALLGITEQQVANFVIGYDAAEAIVPHWDSDEFYWLGRTLRRQAIERGEIEL